jgi:hypothetical protein
MISSMGRWVLIGSLATGAMTAIGFGCTAGGVEGGGPDTDSGASGINDDSSTPGDDGDDGTTVTPDSWRPDAAKRDSGIKDTSVPDTLDGTFTDGNPDTGSTGDPCSPNGQVEYQSCGMCGLQSRVCLANDPTADGGEAGTPVWQGWGFCSGEVRNGCTPGASNSVPCGLCGTQQQICQNDCTWAVSACQGQPPNPCAPDASDFEPGLSCDAGGRSRTCGLNCIWSSFSNTCYIPSPPDGSLTGAAVTISTSTTSGTNQVTKTFDMPLGHTINVLESFTTCPANVVSNMLTSYRYVQVFNPTAQTATVSIWTGAVPGTLDIDTLVAAYKMQTPPATDTQRQQCKWPTKGFSLDSCNDSTGTNPKSCQASWGGLMVGDGNQVTITPYSTIVVYVGAAYNAANPPFGDGGYYGSFQFAVRTETLQ